MPCTSREQRVLGDSSKGTSHGDRYPQSDVLNPDATIWQFFTVQDMLRKGELDGDPQDANDLARHLSGPDSEPLTLAEVVELARQAQDYDETYRS